MTEEGKAMKSRPDAMMKAFKESAPAPAQNKKR
jgi:hypothetical protein